MAEIETTSNRVAVLETRWGNIVSTLTEIKEMIASMRGEFVRKEHHDFKVSALEARVEAIEKAREDERKNGGLMGWAKNVGAVFGAILAVASVVGLVVTVGMMVRR
jgi:hypothetical protein